MKRRSKGETLELLGFLFLLFAFFVFFVVRQPFFNGNQYKERVPQWMT